MEIMAKERGAKLYATDERYCHYNDCWTSDIEKLINIYTCMYM